MNPLYEKSRPEELVPELRDLVNQFPFLAHRGPEGVVRTLRALRGIEADAFLVEAALGALRIEDEVLA